MAEVVLQRGLRGQAMVPSGGPTGENDALELRDGECRYGCKGVRKAVQHIREGIAPALLGRGVLDQEGLDRELPGLDGTPNKSRRGPTPSSSS
jgi:enolase